MTEEASLRSITQPNMRTITKDPTYKLGHTSQDVESSAQHVSAGGSSDQVLATASRSASNFGQ